MKMEHADSFENIKSTKPIRAIRFSVKYEATI